MSDSSAVMRWVTAQNVPPRTTQSLQLPPDLAGHSQDGQVHVAHLADGRLCVLRKTRIGYKDNFEGELLCSGPLRPEEIVGSGGPRPYVSLPGHGLFEELYIRQQHDARRLDVFFDLN